MVDVKKALANELPDILVHQITAEDFSAAFECYQSSFPDGHNRYSFARIIRFQSQTCLVAVTRTDKKIVGIILGFTQPDKAWMTSLSILPDYRRKGYGSALIIQLGLAFFNLGYSFAYATTEEPAIIKLSERVGVCKKSWHENYFFDGQGRYVAEIDLQKNKELILDK